MKLLVVASLVVLVGAVLGDPGASGNVKPPQIFVYTRHPIRHGFENELICHCTGFHPPRIDLQLKQDGQKYDDCQQSDMTFKSDWAYYITKSKKFTPKDGVKYSCDVTHNEGPVKSVILDNPMADAL